MVFYHDERVYPILHCYVEHNEGYPCVFRVKILGNFEFNGGVGQLFFKNKIFAKGAWVYAQVNEGTTECIYRCLAQAIDGFFYFDRITGLPEKADLHDGEKIFHLTPLDEKITQELLPLWCGVYIEAQAKWIYEDEIMVDVASLFPKNTSFPKVGKKIAGGYEVIESKNDEVLRLYGYARHNHQETLHFKMRYQKKGSWLHVKRPFAGHESKRSFFRSNSPVIKALFHEALLHLKAMARCKIIEARFRLDEALDVTLKDRVEFALLSGERVAGKVVGYSLLFSHDAHQVRLKIGLHREMMTLPVFKEPIFSEQNEINWVEESCENFLKMRNLRGFFSQGLHWSIG
jgi:hypothetical protein